MLFPNIEFSIFVIALIANLSILLTVFRYGDDNQSRKLFIFFVLSQMLWVTTNFFSFQSLNESYFLLVTRLTLFFATFHSVAFYLFISNFQDDTNFKNKLDSVIILCSGILIACLTLSPAFFGNLIIDTNGVPAPTTGSLMPLFGLFVGICILSSFYFIFNKYRKSDGVSKTQWRFLAIGLTTTFILVLVFSFLNFVILKNSSTVRFGHLYTLPFVIFTAYAMIKHKLLNIKAVIAEIMVIILNSIIFIQLINSESTTQFFISGLVLIGTLIVGTLLIRGVEKEVQQRELLEALTKELENANEKLKALDKARSEFITIASHQLRTPPATIKWYLSSVLDGDYGKLKSEQKEILEKTNRTNNSLISLVDDMLNVSRIERGKMEFLFQPANLLDLAKITFEQLEPIAKEKGLKLTFKAPKGKFPEIMADKEKVRQVMNNLIDNAIKYTKAGSVNISLRTENGQIVFQTEDTGKGITPEEADSIFEKFSRGKESVKQSAGLGLGLYVAKIIISQHKGKIWAESSGANKGSKFIFSLPTDNGLKETTLVDLTKNQG